MLRGGVKRHDSCNCSARIKHRWYWLSEESCLDGLKEVGTLFSECREIGSNGAEGIGPVIGAESAGDFLFELGHADGAFGEMVIEGDGGVGEETKDVVLIALEAFEEPGGIRLFDGSAVDRIDSLGVFCLSGGHKRGKLFVVSGNSFRRQGRAASGFVGDAKNAPNAR